MTRLEAAATANFVVHASWAASPSPEARVDTGPALTLVDSGLASDTFNIVCAARLTREAVEQTAQSVREHFATVGREFSWWVAPGDEPSDLAASLEAFGLRQAESELAMSANLMIPLDAAPVPGLRVQRVATPEQLATFARINAEHWSPPDTVVEGFYRRGAPALLAAESPLRFSLALLEETPAAAVEVTFANGVAGVYNLSTRAAYRGRGIGAALLAHALLEARAAGFRQAFLQASTAGAGLYRRLGFTGFGVITEHKPTGL